MVVSKDKLSRRKSIAVPTQSSSSSLRPTDIRRKRRAHSIAPGKIISPLSRSRLSLGPVKGILKGVRRKSSESQNHDDRNATQSMDLTNQDNSSSQPSRQSLAARRVSFSSTARVRLFTGSKPGSSTFEPADSSGEAQSSDDPASSSPQKPALVNDENAYPAASGRNRKSIRFSVAESDMDLTSANAGALLQDPEAESALMDEEMDFDDDDMDVTRVHGNVFRKRSLSAHVRAPLTQLSSNPLGEPSSDDPSRSDDTSQSFASERSINSESDQSGMEFTVPLNQALRPPQHNEAWVALVQATHSGAAQAPSSDNSMEDMEVDSPVKSKHIEDDSISDGSFNTGFEDGDETINVSKVLGRFSFGDMGRRESIAYSDMAYLDSAMDEDSEIYGNITGIAATSTPRPSAVVPPSSDPLEPEPVDRTDPPLESNIPPPTVFSRPTEQPSTAPSTRPGSPKKSTFTPKSPAKLTAKGFSAAFAPPVTKPVPRKSLSSSTQQINKPEKRPHDVGSTPPSPAKRQALATKWRFSVSTSPQQGSASFSAEQPRPLSPSKKAAFQSPIASQTLQGATASLTQKPVSSIRRPSGYLARRKSLGIGLGATASAEDISSTVNRTSPKKPKAGIGLGRASVGSGPSDAWKRFDKDTVTQAGGFPNSKGKERAAKPPEITVTPAQESLADPHEPPEDVAMALEQEPTTTQVLDLSTLLEDDGFGDEERESPQEGGLRATEHWREEVPQEGYVEEDIPPISIERFFEMTDIKFMDEITVPRKSIHPELRRNPRPFTEVPLAEYAVAMGVDVPRLVLYSRVARDLEGWLEKSKWNFKEAETEAAQMTPELFIEYARSDEEGQAELRHQLNLIKTNTRLLAKSDWIQWKLQWVESLRVTAQEVFTNLENDAKALEKLKAQADGIVPALQEEYDEIMRELEEEQQEISEIEQCDQGYLNELKASIAEQSLELDSLKNDLKENNDQLQWVQGRLEELESQKEETLAAIAKADRYMNIQKNSTHSEVLRLKAELEALESLHMFRICKVDSRLFEYVYAERFRVTIPCSNHIPLVDKVDITRTYDARTKVKDDFPRLSSILLVGAKQIVHSLSLQSASDTVSTRLIVQTLTDYWSSCAQIRGQLLHLSVKYPVEIEAIQEHLGFKAHAEVLFPAVKGKAILSFVFSSETYAHWPATIRTLECEVKVAYGNLDGRSLLDSVRGRLSQATPSDNYACLLDACIEAQEEHGGG
ncbi:hypothetical protein E1B28_006366 [Marasmius oreades]|uniref:Spc7 kinetochore protein domain-containing protein n=1 Tax=Marasmius oreades TaxID=181124 RepID=A0A9P7UVI1_9AGAR|nr:uncharacterized protein E1B28_006366 [Marasmius oreades]KAG7095643.1 hypothetical protein E1B28_006366 [Marasmius oreades]